MCCAEFIVKYVLFFANVVFSLAGLALIGLGIAVLMQASDLLELIPANIDAIPISIIVIGAVIFLIAFFGCCGAVNENRCFLITYAICMAVLAAAKIYLTVLIFRSLGDIYNTVEGWIRDAFNNTNLREPFHVVEVAFRCCGVNGPGSYDGVYPALPPSCCASPGVVAEGELGACARDDAFGGCANIVADYFELFGDAIGAIMIAVVVVELVAMIFGLFLANSISQKKRYST